MQLSISSASQNAIRYQVGSRDQKTKSLRIRRLVAGRSAWFAHKKIYIHARETRAAGIATSAEQLARRAKRNIEEFPSLDLDPSLDDQMDGQANGQTEGKERETDRQT